MHKPLVGGWHVVLRLSSVPPARQRCSAARVPNLTSVLETARNRCRAGGHDRLASAGATSRDEGNLSCDATGCGYRLADALMVRSHLLAGIYLRSLPDSIASAYFRKVPTAQERKDGWINATALRMSVRERYGELRAPDAAMHVRVEDVIDDNDGLAARDFLCAGRLNWNWRVSAYGGVPEKWARYAPTLQYYDRAAATLQSAQDPPLRRRLATSEAEVLASELHLSADDSARLRGARSVERIALAQVWRWADGAVAGCRLGFCDDGSCTVLYPGRRRLQPPCGADREPREAAADLDVHSLADRP